MVTLEPVAIIPTYRPFGKRIEYKLNTQQRYGITVIFLICRFKYISFAVVKSQKKIR